jgi:hypothetical protein
MTAYSFAPATKPQPNNSTDNQDDIRGLKVGKVPDPDDISSRALKHLSLNFGSLQVMLFDDFSRTKYFPAAWNEARLFRS